MEKKPQDSASRDADKYIVRFPDGMRDRIAEAAKVNNRSMNAEIVARLEASFNAPTGKDPWIEVARIEAEYAAADLILRGLQEQLKQAHAELADAIALGSPAPKIEARQGMVDLLVPLQATAFEEWLQLGARLRVAKHDAMGLEPRGSAQDQVARRVMGSVWDAPHQHPLMGEPSQAPSGTEQEQAKLERSRAAALENSTEPPSRRRRNR